MASPNTPMAWKMLKKSPHLKKLTRDFISKFRISTVKAYSSDNYQRTTHKNSENSVLCSSPSEMCHHNLIGCLVHGNFSNSTLLQFNKTSSIPLPYIHHAYNIQVARNYSTLGKDEPDLNIEIDPFKLIESDMASLASEIKMHLNTEEPLLRTMSHYYFDGKGKTFRPLVALLMSKACNISTKISDSILNKQKTVAIVAEMIHTASLVHDDVIDGSNTRRGQSSLNKLYGQRKSILVGDYILSQASIALARTGNPQVITILSSVLEDLVSGEFMQLGSKEDENERFSHYLKKTYKKTASLIANTCKAVAILGKCDEYMSERAYQYGRNLGIAFQLVDDLLDFVSNELVMGKPTAADLKLGLATAPVLFAAQEYPELHSMIMRRFSVEGDVETARHLVAKSEGVQQTKLLATQHSLEAIKNLQEFSPSDPKTALKRLAVILLERKS
ncbi:Decaprenyl-diphosphate synthase subunit 1 [Bulinus truncatus]|nr:Decaprenyl-diphosphate synthase subunit 1 [Bulinus truncatus]